MNHHSNDQTNSATQDLVDGGSVTISEAAAGQTYHRSTATVHQDDAAKMDEHLELLDLFPVVGQPGVAVALNGGSWFDPSTWASNEVPETDDNVYIPFGVSVVYDGVSDARLDRVAVDGELHFAVDVDTKLMVDTLLTNAGSVLTIGTEDNPVQDGVSAQIIIHRDNGSIDKSSDPLELSKGIVTHGAVRIAGQDKDDHVKALIDPQKGDDFLVFENDVSGWNVGDKLVVAGTKLHGENDFEDEILTIRSIDSSGPNTFVYLDQTLQYDHDTPVTSTGALLQVSVANFTRNVFIGTETDGDQYLGDGKSVPVDERGHVMFMHNDDVSVQNAEFFELGRTDKSVDLDDASNVAGRYALHFHRTGVNDTDEPALAEGNAVWGSPGWGLVHHDSHLDVISNAVFGVNGGAIIAESGNETGKWAENITIQTTGEYHTLNSEHSGSTDHPAGKAQLENDTFKQGIGFGFKSRMIETTDNIAVSSNAAGYSFWPMGTEGPSHINATVENYENLHGYDPFFGEDDVRPSEIPNRVFSGNETIVAHVGFNTSADKRPSQSDVSTIIEDFTAWGVVQGLIGFYQNDYLIKDSLFVGMTEEFGSAHQKSAAGGLTTGIMSREFHEVKIVNNHFENFDLGIWENSHDDSAEFVHVILGNTYTDVGLKQALDVDNSSIDGSYIINNDSANWENQIDLGRLEASIDYAKSDLILTKWYDHFAVVVDKLDSIGKQELSFGSEKGRYGGATQKTWWEENATNKGYYLDNGKFYVVVDIAVGDRVTGTASVASIAIELAFINSANDLPSGAQNLGSLPASLGSFEVVDLRLIGKSGNQLNAPVSDESDEPTHNHDSQNDVPQDETPEEPMNHQQHAQDDEPQDETPEEPMSHDQHALDDTEEESEPQTPTTAPLNSDTNQAVLVDGKSGLSTAGIVLGQNGADFTIEGWVMFAEGDTVSKADGLFYAEDENGKGLDLNFNNGVARLYSRGQKVDLVSTTTIAEEGDWNHYAVTRVDGELSVYVNGTLEGQSDVKFTDAFAFQSLGGSVGGGSGANLNGALDDVRFWKVARTASEIKTALEKTIDDSEAGLEHHYNFEGTGEDSAGDMDLDLVANVFVEDAITVAPSEAVIETPQSSGFDSDPHDVHDATVEDSQSTPVADDPNEQPGQEPSSTAPGKAIQLEGTSISTNGVTLGANGSDFTIEGWIMLAEDKTVSKTDSLFYAEDEDGKGLDLNFHGGIARLYSKGERTDLVSTTTKVEKGEWNHYAITREDGEISIYVNGVLEGEASTSYTEAFSIESLGGSVASGTNSNLEGGLDEVRLWDEARSAVEIQNNFQSNSAPSDPSLIHYYDFDGNNDLNLDAFEFIDGFDAG